MDRTTSQAILESLPPAFLCSLEDAFTQMVMLPVHIGEIKTRVEGAPTGSISGTIGLAGEHSPSGTEIRSQLSLIFSESLAKRIFRSMMMMGDDDPVQTEELLDVVGELANITAGGAKTRLSEDGFALSLSLPSVAVGEGHYLSPPSGVKLSQVATVTLEGEIFYAQISVS